MVLSIDKAEGHAEGVSERTGRTMPILNRPACTGAPTDGGATVLKAEPRRPQLALLYRGSILEIGEQVTGDRPQQSGWEGSILVSSPTHSARTLRVFLGSASVDLRVFRTRVASLVESLG